MGDTGPVACPKKVRNLSALSVAIGTFQIRSLLLSLEFGRKVYFNTEYARAALFLKTVRTKKEDSFSVLKSWIPHVELGPERPLQEAAQLGGRAELRHSIQFLEC